MKRHYAWTTLVIFRRRVVYRLPIPFLIKIENGRGLKRNPLANTDIWLVSQAVEPWQNLSFHQIHEGCAARRNVRHMLAELLLSDKFHSVRAADDRGTVRFTEGRTKAPHNSGPRVY